MNDTAITARFRSAYADYCAQCYGAGDVKNSFQQEHQSDHLRTRTTATSRSTSASLPFLQTLAEVIKTEAALQQAAASTDSTTALGGSNNSGDVVLQGNNTASTSSPTADFDFAAQIRLKLEPCLIKLIQEVLLGKIPPGGDASTTTRREVEQDHDDATTSHLVDLSAVLSSANNLSVTAEEAVLSFIGNGIIGFGQFLSTEQAFDDAEFAKLRKTLGCLIGSSSARKDQIAGNFTSSAASSGEEIVSGVVAAGGQDVEADGNTEDLHWTREYHLFLAMTHLAFDLFQEVVKYAHEGNFENFHCCFIELVSKMDIMIKTADTAVLRQDEKITLSHKRKEFVEKMLEEKRKKEEIEKKKLEEEEKKRLEAEEKKRKLAEEKEKKEEKAKENNKEKKEKNNVEDGTAGNTGWTTSTDEKEKDNTKTKEEKTDLDTKVEDNPQAQAAAGEEANKTSTADDTKLKKVKALMSRDLSLDEIDLNRLASNDKKKSKQFSAKTFDYNRVAHLPDVKPSMKQDINAKVEDWSDSKYFLLANTPFTLNQFNNNEYLEIQTMKKQQSLFLQNAYSAHYKTTLALAHLIKTYGDRLWLFGKGSGNDAALSVMEHQIGGSKSSAASTDFDSEDEGSEELGLDQHEVTQEDDAASLAGDDLNLNDFQLSATAAAAFAQEGSTSLNTTALSGVVNQKDMEAVLTAEARASSSSSSAENKLEENKDLFNLDSFGYKELKKGKEIFSSPAGREESAGLDSDLSSKNVVMHRRGPRNGSKTSKQRSESKSKDQRNRGEGHQLGDHDQNLISPNLDDELMQSLNSQKNLEDIINEQIRSNETALQLADSGIISPKSAVLTGGKMTKGSTSRHDEVLEDADHEVIDIAATSKKKQKYFDKLELFNEYRQDAYRVLEQGLELENKMIRNIQRFSKPNILNRYGEPVQNFLYQVLASALKSSPAAAGAQLPGAASKTTTGAAGAAGSAASKIKGTADKQAKSLGPKLLTQSGLIPDLQDSTTTQDIFTVQGFHTLLKQIDQKLEQKQVNSSGNNTAASSSAKKQKVASKFEMFQNLKIPEERLQKYLDLLKCVFRNKQMVKKQYSWVKADEEDESPVPQPPKNFYVASKVTEQQEAAKKRKLEREQSEKNGLLKKRKVCTLIATNPMETVEAKDSESVLANPVGSIHLSKDLRPRALKDLHDMVKKHNAVTDTYNPQMNAGKTRNDMSDAVVKTNVVSALNLFDLTEQDIHKFQIPPKIHQLRDSQRNNANAINRVKALEEQQNNAKSRLHYLFWNIVMKHLNSDAMLNELEEAASRKQEISPVYSKWAKSCFLCLDYMQEVQAHYTVVPQRTKVPTVSAKNSKHIPFGEPVNQWQYAAHKGTNGVMNQQAKSISNSGSKSSNTALSEIYKQHSIPRKPFHVLLKQGNIKTSRDEKIPAVTSGHCKKFGLNLPLSSTNKFSNTLNPSFIGSLTSRLPTGNVGFSSDADRFQLQFSAPEFQLWVAIQILSFLQALGYDSKKPTAQPATTAVFDPKTHAENHRQITGRSAFKLNFPTNMGQKSSKQAKVSQGIVELKRKCVAIMSTVDPNFARVLVLKDFNTELFLTSWKRGSTCDPVMGAVCDKKLFPKLEAEEEVALSVVAGKINKSSVTTTADGTAADKAATTSKAAAGQKITASLVPTKKKKKKLDFYSKWQDEVGEELVKELDADPSKPQLIQSLDSWKQSHDKWLVENGFKPAEQATNAAAADHTTTGLVQNTATGLMVKTFQDSGVAFSQLVAAGGGPGSSGAANAAAALGHLSPGAGGGATDKKEQDTFSEYSDVDTDEISELSDSDDELDEAGFNIGGSTEKRKNIKGTNNLLGPHSNLQNDQMDHHNNMLEAMSSSAGDDDDDDGENHVNMDEEQMNNDFIRNNNPLRSSENSEDEDLDSSLSDLDSSVGEYSFGDSEDSDSLSSSEDEGGETDPQPMVNGHHGGGSSTLMNGHSGVSSGNEDHTTSNKRFSNDSQNGTGKMIIDEVTTVTAFREKHRRSLQELKKEKKRKRKLKKQKQNKRVQKRSKHFLDYKRKTHELKSIEQFTEILKMDETGESGLEEEYMNKYDTVFMWQLKRLFTQEYMFETLVERDKKSFEDRFVNNAMSNYQLPYVEEGDEQDEVKEDWSKDFLEFLWKVKGYDAKGFEELREMKEMEADEDDEEERLNRLMAEQFGEDDALGDLVASPNESEKSNEKSKDSTGGGRKEVGLDKEDEDIMEGNNNKRDHSRAVSKNGGKQAD
ncbi:unnamed protein product [Amoebophrya sp. A120]|nr:unnamed protein product [Amoebophrya sp. A120]|eukprot:GSA120T00013284001.1